MIHQDWITKAEKLKPLLAEVSQEPCAEVRIVSDPQAFQGWRAETVQGFTADQGEGALRDRIFHAGDSVILDFGEHLVGYLQLRLEPVGPADAPARLKFLFAEIPAELGAPLEQYTRPQDRFGISRSWIQDETATIEDVPAEVRLSRRYAFRYVKIQVVDTSAGYTLKFTRISVGRVSSADPIQTSPPVAESTGDLIRQLDTVSQNTLRNCMQTVFEDGPKRDRRLWLGDLRLEALTNYETFANYDLVRRCLYLFAAFPRPDKLLTACVYERPEPHMGDCSILDYAALFAPTLLDYLEASGDLDTAQELWPVAKDQLRLLEYVNGEGLFKDPGNWWLFVDWQATLHKETAIQGILIYMMRQTLRLAEKLGRTAEVGNLPSQIQKISQAAQQHLWDAPRQVFISGPDRQVSYASQAWMILAGVPTPDQAKAAWAGIAKLEQQANPQVVLPAGPYLWHYVLEAMLSCGLGAEARRRMEQYWGAMLKLGATTFWEVFDPANDQLTPYSDPLTNSFCHAWSCTPSYFIRKYPDVFQV